MILTGAGEKAFVAGADISEFSSYSPIEAENLSRDGGLVFTAIERSSKPVIAAVNGFALGGGCELAMACQLRIASENAKFGQPEVNLGLIPGYAGTQRLVQLIGKGKALEYLMTADLIPAAEALHLGLVNYVVPQTELLAKCTAILQKISGKAPLAIAAIIRCVNSHFAYHEDGFETEIREFGKSFGTADFKEGARAFLEKRKPEFKGL
jgi:enoyl-CoA hydratase